MASVSNNVARVKDRIAAALRRAGRESDEITIVGVTKTLGAGCVEELIKSGIDDIGENRIQESLKKMESVSLECRWHLIGTLQRNKAAKAMGRFNLIHSVDSVKLAATLSRLGREKGILTNILIEVNTSGEESKHGFNPDKAVDAAGAIIAMPNIELKGLMTIGPLTDDESEVRGSFKMLRTLRDRTEMFLGEKLPELSMGMSDDFEIALDEGSTMIRLGRILTGPRRV